MKHYENYDDWKLATPEDEGEQENECRFCSKPCDGEYCDSTCYKNDLKE